MPRANRYFVPNHIWHITHRCHNRDHLLKFEQERKSWLYWLSMARRRHDLCILDYTVTRNHIHLLVFDTGEEDTIPLSMQLIAGSTAQDYNRRKTRRGAYWEDRYHATAVESRSHLLRCVAYIDLNMVRAGVVDHPARWPHGGFHEIQAKSLRGRQALLNLEKLAELTGASTVEQFREMHAEALENGLLGLEVAQRDEKWTRSIAVGSRGFVDGFAAQLGPRAQRRSILEADDSNVAVLRETRATYGGESESEACVLKGDNALCWELLE